MNDKQVLEVRFVNLVYANVRGNKTMTSFIIASDVSIIKELQNTKNKRKAEHVEVVNEQVKRFKGDHFPTEQWEHPGDWELYKSVYTFTPEWRSLDPKEFDTLWVPTGKPPSSVSEEELQKLRNSIKNSGDPMARLLFKQQVPEALVPVEWLSQQFKRLHTVSTTTDRTIDRLSRQAFGADAFDMWIRAIYSYNGHMKTLYEMFKYVTPEMEAKWRQVKYDTEEDMLADASKFGSQK